MRGSGAQPAFQPANGALPEGRSPLAHLLHALNQPLTGLQCSLELAAAGPRRQEQYIRTLREGLELTCRMRLLVEAIRELTDAEPADGDEGESFLLDALLRETVDDLRPVAEIRNVPLLLACEAPLPVQAGHRRLGALLFRLLESALNLAREGCDLRIAATRERERAVLVVSWSAAPPPEHSPFSRPELGLLIARAGWERAGAEWITVRSGDAQTCTVRLPLAPGPHCKSAAPENLK